MPMVKKYTTTTIRRICTNVSPPELSLVSELLDLLRTFFLFFFSAVVVGTSVGYEVGNDVGKKVGTGGKWSVWITLRLELWIWLEVTWMLLAAISADFVVLCGQSKKNIKRYGNKGLTYLILVIFEQLLWCFLFTLLGQISLSKQPNFFYLKLAAISMHLLQARPLLSKLHTISVISELRFCLR